MGVSGAVFAAGERVLVTGGSGFIGTNLVQALDDAGVQVLNLDIAAPRDAGQAARWQRADLCDRVGLEHALRAFSPTLVFHLGARTDLDGKTEADYAANIEGVQNLVDVLARLSGVRRVLFASSRLVCRIGYQPLHDEDYCPTTVYGASKIRGERIVRSACADAGYEWAILRPTSIWGPWFGVPYRLFFDAVMRGRYVHPRGVRVHKSFGFVGNTVHELLHLAAAPGAVWHRKTLYLADYPPIEVGAMAQEIRRQLGAGPVREVPRALLQGAAWVGDAAKALGWKEPPLTSFRLANLVQPMVHDLAPLQTLVGELPFTMPEGVARTLAWMRQQGQAA